MSGRFRTLALVTLALVATAALWQHPGFLSGGYDFRYFESAMEAARRNIAWFHQAPLYDPWMCGGEAQLANPQSIAGSPAFLLVVLFGTAVGTKLMMVLFIALGLDGMYRLARQSGLGGEASLASALTFGLSGWVVAHFAIGHVSFFGATLLPYLVCFYRRGLDDLRWAVAAGAVAALIVLTGGTSTAVMAAVCLAAIIVVDVVTLKTARPLGVAVTAGVCALAFGAYRILPALEFAIDHPRHTVETDRFGLVSLLRAAVSLDVAGKLPGQRYALHEYVWRLPLLAWPLIVLGGIALWKRTLPTQRLDLTVLLVALVGVGVAMGDALPYGPWWVMRHVPVLRDLRAPSRYVLLVALALSLLAGAGVEALRERISGRSIVLVVLGLLALDGVVFANRAFTGVFMLPAPPISHASFQQVQGHWSQMLPLVYANRGDVGCDEEAPLTRAKALELGDVPQARLEDPSAGRVDRIEWTPNGYTVTLTTTRPTTLLLDMNWSEHFHASVGSVKRWGDKWPADKDGGRLAVELPPTAGTVTVRYLPRTFVLGCIVTLLAALSTLFLARRARPRKGDATRTIG
ncbi:MAG: hypothetical protein ABI321_00670 [Polyangia bacterium]